MSFLRAAPRLVRTAAPRPAFAAATTLQYQPRRLAHQDYGSGDGNPVGENPQAQGKNPSEDKEHPGPASPASSGGNNSSSPGQQESSQGNSSSKPQPKIYNAQPPPDQEAPEDVRRHNEEMKKKGYNKHA